MNPESSRTPLRIRNMDPGSSRTFSLPEPSSPTKPFGIRGLLSPSKPFSVLQIHPSQYDMTIHSFPEAALTWLDNDDGETVTVGSAEELQDRLQDKTPVDAPLVSFYNVKKEQRESQQIHIFDILKSSASLNTWREHEAYWSKTQHEGTELEKIKDMVDGAQSSTEITQPEDTDWTKPTESIAPAISNGQPLTFTEILPDLLEGLATLLKGTSDILQIAATKIQETNTTPIEDVLSGMTKIVGEASACGLELLKSLDHSTSKEPEQHSTAASTMPAMSATAESLESPAKIFDIVDDLQRLSFTDRGDVDMASSSTDLRTSQIQQSKPPSTTESLVSKPDVPQLPQACGASFASPSTFLRPITFHTPATQGSLLDQDAEDADFTARYPPLATLRRAKTIGGMYAAAHGSNLGDQSALAPNRPSPQIFDAETRRRKQFAQACFPTQQYTPDSDAANAVMYPKIKRHVSPDRKKKIEDVEEAAKLVDNGPPSSVARDTINAQAFTTSTSPTKTSVPGAWPDPDAIADLASDNAASESSGAFFNRMINQRVSRRARKTQPMVEQYRQRQEQLARMMTQYAEGNLNSISGLGHPFTSIPQSSASNATISHVPENKSNVTFKRARMNAQEPAEKRPRSLYEPYRSFSNHRSFSPVWEDHLQQNETSPLGTKKEMPTPPAKLQYYRSLQQRNDRGVHRMRSMPSFATSARPNPPRFRDLSRSDSVSKKNVTPAGLASADSALNQYTKSGPVNELAFCEKQLRAMGFGQNDPDLLARLHVYAAAANGCVDEAVDMINDDQQAHKDVEQLRDELKSTQASLEEPFGSFAWHQQGI